MQNGLYHKDIFLPAPIKNLGATKIALRPTFHATQAALSDRYGKVNIPSHLEFTGKDIIEAEMANGKLVKLVIRKAHDTATDAIFVVIPKCGTVKTVWLNNRTDKHATLNRSRYAMR